MIINYQKIMEQQIGKINAAETRPSLLLHSCCGPCSSVALERLFEHFNITLLYYNPNIAPKSEFNLRLSEQEKLVKKAGLNLKIVAPEYNQNEFLSCSLGLEACPEGGARCQKCFELRLEKTAKIAGELGQKYFATTLTTSPHKDAQVINELGLKISSLSGVLFLCTDFKKKDGYKRSIEISKKYDIYRQNYCGCLYSLRKTD